MPIDHCQLAKEQKKMDYLETAPYQAQIDQLKRLYNTNKKNLKADNARALREMYVSRMMAERDLPNRLSAYGMHGGLSETSELDLRNTYSRSRAEQEQAYQRNLADLTNAYQGNVGQLKALIAAVLARMAAEQARAQAQAWGHTAQSAPAPGTALQDMFPVKGGAVLQRRKRGGGAGSMYTAVN